MELRIKNNQLNPELNDMELGHVKLIYSKHALERAAEKQINLIYSANIVKGSIVETYEDSNNMVRKIVVRVRYDNEMDMVLVLAPAGEPKKAKVITVWLNHVNDNHKTLKLKSINYRLTNQGRAA